MAEHMFRRVALAATAVSVAVVTAAVPAGAATTAAGTVVIGPNTTTAPYVLPSVDGVTVTSLVTVNDAGRARNGYELVGIPDGIGLQQRPDGRVRLQVNHEISLGLGIVRKHGQDGAFVSDYLLDSTTNAVLAGADLIRPGVTYFDYQTGAYSPTPGAPTGATSGHTASFQRFCSGTLSERNALLSSTGKGTAQQFYFANEEIGVEGRVFAVDLAGKAVQLPRLGLLSWENTVPAPTTGDATVVMGDDDSLNGTVTAYVGRKTISGATALAKAGLTNGRNYAVKLADVTTDAAFRAAHDAGDAVRFSLNDVEWNQSGAAQEAEGIAEGVMQFNRVEDGAFDPANPNDYYFLTTEGGEGTGGGGGGGLWRLRYDDVNNPTAGGTVTLLLDGTESITLNKPDNMSIDTHGNLMIQEDPGGNDQLSRILAYRIADGAIGTVAQFDPEQFLPGGSRFLTNDEESSGILDAEAVTGQAGSFYFDAQVHSATGLPAGTGPGTVQEYVELGQLLRLDVSDFATVYAQG